MFNIEEYDIEGLLSIKANNFSDKRGSLTKIFQIEDFKNIGIEEQFKEEYYSISKNG
ncbi:MAG: dTDP-4-dehydrorhamnose 3,5-epimerase family protein, partial [Sarcina sp.]